MRDNLCNEENLLAAIEDNDEGIAERLEKIEMLIEDTKNGIQQFPLENDKVIFNAKKQIFLWLKEEINAKYSLGAECGQIEELFHKAVPYISEIGYEKIGYVNMVGFISLAILFNAPQKEFQALVDVADNAQADDILLDCLAIFYGIKRNFKSTKFEKENPYAKALEIIKTAVNEKAAASTALVEYAKNQWLEGHSDYGWDKAFKRPNYYGLWSFEAAAIAKLFNLDDSALKDDNHYPYDLAHFKKKITVTTTVDLDNDEPAEIAGEDKSIPENPELEQIIPSQFRDEINQLIVDFSSLSDEDFWEKYDLEELYFTVEEYTDEKSENDILGSIIIDRLVVLGYVLQLDYKENIADYTDKIKNYWNTSEVRLIRFELDNDQYYYAKVPVSCNLTNVYEVEICE